MNSEDAARLRAERDASPSRWRDYDPSDNLRERWYAEHPVSPPVAPPSPSANAPTQGEPPRQEEVEDATLRPSRASRASSATSSLSSLTTMNTRRASQAASMSAQRTMTTGTNIARLDTAHRDRAVFEYLERHPTAIGRINQHRLQHSLTVGQTRSRPEKPLPDFGGNKPYPPLLPDREEYVVEFSGHDDPNHPQNWPTKQKLIIFSVLVFNSLSATFASSIFSAASMSVGAHFHVGNEVITLGTSLFVLGYAFGPIAWAPFSELYGRRLPVILAASMFGIFEIGVSVAKDLQTVLICRFFAGLFGSCALTIVPAVFADMFNNKYRGLAVAAFSATIFNGPLLGPLVGGFITKSYLGWRWTQYIPAIMGFTAAILAFFFQKESYPPIILVEKASELRRLTRNWGIHAKQDEVEVDFKELIQKNVGRPLRILFLEPIVLLVTIYMSFLYGILYLSFTAYALIWGRVYGFSPGVSGLPYFALIVGVFIGFAAFLLENPGYVKKLEANENVPVPEWRLLLPMIGGVSFAVGLFWLAWTGYQGTIHWIVPTLSGVLIGFGIYTVFLQLLNYIIDSYLMFAASAIAANTLLRSLFGAIFPLFATYMFEGIGINWGLTLLGCVSVLLIPMPFIFFFFGKRIRAKSKFAPAPDLALDKKRREAEAGGENGSSSQEDGSGGKKKDA
ncbi:hypothetical protein LTR95_004645 [Oleoguttula sp. CCFEE 5521]